MFAVFVVWHLPLVDLSCGLRCYEKPSFITYIGCCYSFCVYFDMSRVVVVLLLLACGCEVSRETSTTRTEPIQVLISWSCVQIWARTRHR